MLNGAGAALRATVSVCFPWGREEAKPLALPIAQEKPPSGDLKLRQGQSSERAETALLRVRCSKAEYGPLRRPQ